MLVERLNKRQLIINILLFIICEFVLWEIAIVLTWIRWNFNVLWILTVTNIVVHGIIFLIVTYIIKLIIKSTIKSPFISVIILVFLLILPFALFNRVMLLSGKFPLFTFRPAVLVNEQYEQIEMISPDLYTNIVAVLNKCNVPYKEESGKIKTTLEIAYNKKLSYYITGMATNNSMQNAETGNAD